MTKIQNMKIFLIYLLDFQNVKAKKTNFNNKKTKK